ncbi:MAG TPA: FAD-linked oxidase C-terminal domain-containing protein [Polyangiales bacterium]|nr:FAD-linked oxidase C-terminal domain-containing protein [Polyangiales bacterium]
MSRETRALSELHAVLGDGLLTDPDVIESYRRDRTTWAAVGQPLAVARPASTAEVRAIARWATRHRTPIVPRGAGTSISGGACASDGCLVLSFERMNRILAIDEAAMLAVVQPGVLNEALKLAVAERGLWYPPDPSSAAISTIGGNVATNAGGLCCVKYGVTADYVLGLEAVLADGTVVRTGGKSRKDVAGYDLTRLLVGSEGTLALISEITVRLRRRPNARRTLLATFDTLEASGRAVSNIVTTADASLLEIMDRATLRAVERHAKLELDLDAAAMLIAQSDAASTSEVERMLEACQQAGSTFSTLTEDEAEGQLLLTARRLAYPALEALGDVMVEDVAVPISQLAEMLRRVERLAERTGTSIATVAHAGDGNLHPLIVFDRRIAAEEARALAAFETLMVEALELGGTITGEHGVGSLKREFLPRQLGAASMALHGKIKSAFDPLGILNPGKLL